MARDTKTQSLHERAASATANSAKSAHIVLHSVDQIADDKGKGTDCIFELIALCNSATDHLAQANKLLFSNPDNAETAIAELDAALECLKRVTADGKARLEASAQSA